MYQGKHTSRNTKRAASRKRPLRWNRSFVVLASVVVLIMGAVGGTLAYLVDDTAPVVNTFTPGKVSCEIKEEFNGQTKSNVTITNTGNTDAYIRAAIVVTWVDGNGNIASKAPVQGVDYTLDINNGDWTLANGYYYYKQSVAPNGTTTNLIKSCTPKANMAPDGYTLCVDIIADAIQAKGTDGNGKTPAELFWGYTPSAS